MSTPTKSDPVQLGKALMGQLSVRPSLPVDYSSRRAVAEALQVVDQESEDIANAMILDSDRWIKGVEALYEDGRAMANTLHKWFTGQIKTLSSPYDVKTILAPKIKAFRDKQARERAIAAQLRAQQEAARVRAAQEEASRLQREADAQAAELRRAGDMRAAREAQEQAQQAARSIVQEAQDVAVILPESKPVGGPQELRPWIGEVTDIRAVCRAVGGDVDRTELVRLLNVAAFDSNDIADIVKIVELATKSIPLEYSVPVRGKGEELRPLVLVDQQTLNPIAKRYGQADIGIPGARGKADLQLRFTAPRAAKAVLSTDPGEFEF